MNILALSGVSLAAGAFVLAIAVSTSRDSGPGTGFRGYTTGFRIRLWLSYILGIAHVLAGLAGIRHHFRVQSQPPIQAAPRDGEP